MITLNRERGFENVETWDEIVALPGFTPELNPTKYKLDAIIGRYIFKDKIPCGLSSCRQPHGKGYIVTTKTGEVTNIGNTCGKTHFGVDFDEQSKIFERSLSEHNNREIVGSFVIQLESIISQIEDIRTRDKGADWVYKTSCSLLHKNRGCPESITSQVGRQVRERSEMIMVPREATEEEIKEMEVMQNKALPRPQIIEEQKGILNGLEILFKENDIRDILILDIETNLNALSNLDIDSASYKELRHWSKWCGEFGSKIEKVENIISIGHKLLTTENLSQLFQVTQQQQDDMTMFKNWLKTHIP